MVTAAEPRPTAWVVTDPKIWDQILDVRKYEIRLWLTLNEISPRNIPIESTVYVTENPDGEWEIHYEAYLRTEDGRIQVDPDNPKEAFVEDRISPMLFDPPMHWLVPVVDEGDTTGTATDD